MNIHTTNYTDTFIAIADDSPATAGEAPPVKGDKQTVANIEYDLLRTHPPYTFTSDEVLFRVYAQRNDLTKAALQKAKELFFSKGQPCMRASPLAKRYGWGIHNDAAGKIALIGCETPAYKKMIEDPKLKVVKAMRSSKG